MASNGGYAYAQLLGQLSTYSNIPEDLLSSLRSYSLSIYRSNQQDRYSEPMPWIGIYIASASFLCILAMVADLLHGLGNRKLWFPNKYFTLNAASLSVIAVAMKLPMDLSSIMPGVVDQNVKLGSMAFMCTMMVNLLPSLATVDNKELVANIIGLGVLVITLVVNVCIQIRTGLLPYSFDDQDFENIYSNYNTRQQSSRVDECVSISVAIIYVVMLLVLLIIQTCSALTIPTSKRILESKYQEVHESSLMDQQQGTLHVEKLKQHVCNYWTMAETGSPQFMTACSATSSATGVICLFNTFLQIVVMLVTKKYLWDYKSDYKWSMVVILMVQFFGVLLGTIAPFCRCLTALSFKLSTKWIWNHIKVFKVESYWTQKLYYLKQSSTAYPFHSRKSKIVIQNLKILILSICIGIQKSVVVVCKTIALIPIFFVVCVSYCLRCLERIMAMISVSSIVIINEPNRVEENEDLSKYVLRLQDDMELAERTLKRISQSVNRFIQKAQKKQPNNLTMLIKESSCFKGVGNYDNHHIPSLLTREYRNCWSLPLVTLTTIAISLPNIQNNMVDRLLRGVSEGLTYVALVEESLNATDDYVSIKKAAKTLWLEVEVYHKWLGNKLQTLAPQTDSTAQILHRLKNTAKNLVIAVESTDICKSFSANLMYRITETILLSYHTSIDQVSHEDLLAQLSSTISDILAACLTNLPQVIVMKCHTNAIENREASVHAAAQLLGETTQIISTLQDRLLPRLNLDDLPFIDKWRASLNHIP